MVNNTVIHDISSVDSFDFNGLTGIYGHFNQIHAGHLRYLDYALSFGSDLVVFLATDDYLYEQGVERIRNLEQRILSLSCYSFIRHIVVLNKPLRESVVKSGVRLLVLGDRFNEEPGQEISELTSDETLANQLMIRYQRLGSETVQPNNEFFKLSRNAFVSGVDLTLREEVSRLLERMRAREFDGARLFFLGDLIVDKYIFCEPVGMSQEAPLIVLNERSTYHYIGGIGCLARHAASLGAQVTLLSVVGQDSIGDRVEADLVGDGVHPLLIRDSQRPTTIKTRFLGSGHKLLRVNRLSNEPVEEDIKNKMIKYLNDHLNHKDILVISDFSHGLLNHSFISRLREIARGKGASIFGDSQASSQVGKLHAFSGFDFVSPNEREARMVVDRPNLSVEELGRELLRTLGVSSLFLKLSSEGVVLFNMRDEDINSFGVPAFSDSVVDVTGAGDAMLAVFSVCSLLGGSQEASAIICSIAAKIVVERYGNEPVGLDDLMASW